MTMSATLAVPEVTISARQKLERIVHHGRDNAHALLERVLNDTPDDALVQGDCLSFDVGPGTVRMHSGDAAWALHPNALTQVAGKAGIPVSYMRALAGSEPNGSGSREDPAWRHRLLETNLRELFSNQGGRFLVRSVRGEARGFLSDRYRRLDSRPLLDAFVGACSGVGAVPYEGVVSDLSVSLRAIVPEVLEPVPGEHLVFGLCWSNSDFGTRAYSISAFTLRLVCLNGMVGANDLKQVHLGGRLPDSIEFSERTYQLDTKTMVSATRDVVESALGASAIERQLGMIRSAHEDERGWEIAWRRVCRDLTKAEQQRAKETFDGPETVLLPSRKSPWRLSNVLGWMANQTEDTERKQDLQRFAGTVLETHAASTATSKRSS